MKDRTIVIISLLIASLMLSIAPAFAFYHPSTGLEDNMFENFGPRIDRILVKMYGTLDAEIAALQAGEIDITDWPLTKTMITTLSADPNVVVLGYGGEAGEYEINFNNNNNQYLGNPPNPAAPNPVYQNPGSVAAFRQAVSTSINNTYLCTVLAEGLYDPIYTPIPSYMAFWIHPDIRPGGALEALTWPYDGPLFPNSNAKLDANGFPINVGTGFRYWDRNSDGIEQADELIDLDVYTRADILRKSAGDMEAAGLTAMHIRFTRFEVTGAQAYVVCMVEQNYFSYTCGWINIGPDPDYMYDLWSYESYFWDGANGPANWAAIGKYNPGQNADLLALKTASNVPDALAAARAFQVKFASDACEKPLASTAAPKAFSKYYTGGTDGVPVSPDDGENEYRGHQWDDIVNQKGFGENSWWSTLNMHPVGHEQGDGTFMTVRYGWEQTGMPVKINPIYSSWYWESELWGRVMDGGGGRNPMTLGPVEVPQLMESWTQGTWVDPADGITKASVTVTLKPDSKWSDGQPVTIDDFIYTLAILPGELLAKGCSDAWWQATLDQVAGYYKLDDYSALILMRSNTYLATTWIVGNVILPKHFWQPYVAANPALTIMGDLGTGLIGTGPFLYTALVPGTSATLIRNPIYYLAKPVDVKMTFVATDGSINISPNKIKPNVAGFGTAEMTLVITDTNEQKFFAVTYTMTVTIQKVAGSGAPGPVTPVAGVVSPVTIIAGGSNTQNFALSLAKGEYEVVVTKVITSPAWEFFYNPIVRTERVKATVAGDLNGDWKVNILDITPIAIRFGAVRGDAGSPPLPKYDAIADLNHDGKINILDIVQVALVFGWDATIP